MAATATATKTAPARRQAPARTRRQAPRKPAARATAAPTLRRARSQRRPTAGWLVPVAAVGRTAVAVGGIAESGLVHRLTRGRLWIGLLATLLVGIVGLNVVALSFSATASNTAHEADELKRLNSAARATLASQLSNDELRLAAEKLGLTIPSPNAISYLKPGADDAAIAAQRLRDGELTSGATSAAGTVPLESTPEVAQTEPVVEPAATELASADPATTSLAAAPSAETATAPPVTETAATETAVGGVAAP